MELGLLRTIAKFAAGPVVNVANRVLGSPGYSLGSGDNANVPASAVFKHSILPSVAGMAIGGGLGYMGGHMLPGALESVGAIGPADVGDSLSDAIRSKAPMVGGFIGSALGQAAVLKPSFMHGVRDAQDAAAAESGGALNAPPWELNSAAGPWRQGTSSVRVPWSDKPPMAS